MLFPSGENRGLLIHPEVSYKTFPMGYSSRSNPFTTCTTASCSSGLQVASRTFSSTSRGAPPESGIRASVTGRRSSAPTCSSTASSFDFEMPTTRVSSVPIGCACGASARHWYKRLAPPAHAASKMMVWPSDVKRAAPTLPEPKVMRSKVAGACLGIWRHKNHIAAAPASRTLTATSAIARMFLNAATCCAEAAAAAAVAMEEPAPMDEISERLARLKATSRAD